MTGFEYKSLKCLQLWTEFALCENEDGDVTFLSSKNHLDEQHVTLNVFNAQSIFSSLKQIVLPS